MRRASLLAATLVLGLGGRVQAQQQVRFDLATDSVLAIRVGTSAKVVLSSDCWVGSYDVTLFFDGSRVQLTGAAAITDVTLPAPTISAGTDSARLVASGSAPLSGCIPQEMATLTFAMSPGATTGSLVTMRINDLTTVEGANVTSESVAGLLDVCQALHTWGDLDDNGAISSRDALIALTAAVGLPTPGFIAANADVDADSIVTARDALFILSDGIGLGSGGTRIEQAIANHCAPLAPAPNDLLYWTVNGTTLNRVAAGDTTPTMITLPITGNTSYAARLSPDGGKIVYACQTVPDENLCTVDPNGGDLHELQVGGGTQMRFPTWSPDGTQIAYVDYNGGDTDLQVADTSGSFSQILAGYTILTLGGWSANGIVFTGYYTSNGFSHRLWIVQANGSSVHEVFSNSSTQTPADPSWSPAADSIAFSNGSFEPVSIFVVSLAGDAECECTLPGVRRGQLIGQAETPAWLVAGIGFRSQALSSGRAEVFLRTPTGRYFRLTRSTNSTGASRPSFR